MPNLRFTLLQIAIGALDLGLVTLAMYTLLPLRPAVDFAAVLFIFLTASLVGTVSHAPGSVGILEAAMFVGLPQFQRENLLVSLLTFRFLYFVLPLVLAALLLGLREVRIVVKRANSYQQG